MRKIILLKLQNNYLNHKDPISLLKNGKLLKRKKDYIIENSKVILKIIPKKNDKFSVIYLRIPTIGVAEFPPIYTVLAIDLCKSISNKSYDFSDFINNVYKYSEYKKMINNSVLYKLEKYRNYNQSANYKAQQTCFIFDFDHSSAIRFIKHLKSIFLIFENPFLGSGFWS